MTDTLQKGPPYSYPESFHTYSVLRVPSIPQTPENQIPL